MATVTSDDAPLVTSVRRGAGPLTTVFTTPDFCGSGLWSSTNVPPLHSEICMPPKFHSLYAYKFAFYSPGICPSGFSEGCAFPTSLATRTLGTDMYGGPLLLGETARVCCPTGYQCYTSGSQSESFWSNCISTEPLTTHWQWDYGKGTDVMTTTEALAYAIQVRWQASDLSILATDPTVPGSTFNGPTPTPTPTASVTAATSAAGAQAEGGSRGISTGALTAIAIAVPVGLVVFGVVAFFLWRRNYRDKHARKDASTTEEKTDNSSGMGPSSSTRLNPELLSPHDGQRSDTPNTALVSPLTPNTMFAGHSTTELDSHTVNEMDAQSVYEADSKTRQVMEMEAANRVHEMPHTFVAELDGTPVEWRRAGEVAGGNAHMRQRSLSRTTEPLPLKS